MQLRVGERERGNKVFTLFFVSWFIAKNETILLNWENLQLSSSCSLLQFFFFRSLSLGRVDGIAYPIDGVIGIG